MVNTAPDHKQGLLYTCMCSNSNCMFLSLIGESFHQIYDETDLQRAKLELLSSTNMVDFAMDIHKSLYPDQVVPAELPERRSRVVSELKRLQVS